MSAADVILGGQWVFLLYFVGINLGYLSQNVIATLGIRRYLQTADQFEAEGVFSALDIPISLVVPAYNESASIIHTRTSLAMICSWTSRGSWSHTSSAGNGLFSSRVAPGRA